MPTAPLDTRYQIETPEGIDLPLRPAGLVPRALAFTFDLGARAVIMGVLLVPLALLGNIGIGLGSLLLFLVRVAHPQPAALCRYAALRVLSRRHQLPATPSLQTPWRPGCRHAGDLP